MAELVDARDSKSRTRKGVRVRFPPSAQSKQLLHVFGHQSRISQTVRIICFINVMAKLIANELRDGVVFIYRDAPWSVIKYEHIKHGRGSATIKVRIKNVKTGEAIMAAFDQNQVFEEADVVKTSGQYLYTDDKSAYFMQTTTYDQYSVDKTVVADALRWLSEGGKVTMVLFEDGLVGVELPKTVNLKAVYAEPAVKGNTSAGAMKRVKLESGAEVDVPLFIKQGQILKINTETGTYAGRVTD